MKTLPNDSKARYQFPIASGCIAYFPAALAGVAKHSYIGGAKYNDGALVHLRYISTQHMDCIGRHLLDLQDLLAARDRGETTVETYVYDFDAKADVLRNIPIDEAILIECNALAWRSLAVSQELHERLAHTPLAPAARTQALTTNVELLGFGRNRVAAVKAIRTLTQCGLKDAIDIVNSLPRTIECLPSFTHGEAVRLLTEAGGMAR